MRGYYSIGATWLTLLAAITGAPATGQVVTKVPNKLGLDIESVALDTAAATAKIVVRNTSGRDRLSFPLFFDPDFAAEIKPLPRQSRLDAARSAAETAERWDGVSVHRFSGTYGDYLLSKVAKVFPHLSRKVL